MNCLKILYDFYKNLMNVIFVRTAVINVSTQKIHKSRQVLTYAM